MTQFAAWECLDKHHGNITFNNGAPSRGPDVPRHSAGAGNDVPARSSYSRLGSAQNLAGVADCDWGSQTIEHNPAASSSQGAPDIGLVRQQAKGAWQEALVGRRKI